MALLDFIVKLWSEIMSSFSELYAWLSAPAQQGVTHVASDLLGDGFFGGLGDILLSPLQLFIPADTSWFVLLFGSFLTVIIAVNMINWITDIWS